MHAGCERFTVALTRSSVKTSGDTLARGRFLAIANSMRGHAERELPPILYRDTRRRLWYASEVAQLKVVSAAIDGPSHFLVIRFECEGEERFARWIGGEEWRQREALQRLFAESEPVYAVEIEPAALVAVPNDDTGVGPAPAETVELCVKLIATMGHDELSDFEERTFRQWDRASLGDLRRAIERRRRELVG